MIKLLIFTILLTSSSFIYSQRQTAKFIIPDTIISLKKGIYLNIEEFLNNEPSITCDFEVTHDGQTYIIHPEENNYYYVTYYDNLGAKIKLWIKYIWGFYNGNGVFVSYENRPYELLSLGTISVLRYDRYYTKNTISQIVSMNVLGATTTNIHKIRDAYLDLKNDTVVSARRKQFEKLIKNDIDFYDDYKMDKKTDKQIKPMIYLEKYNKKHPILISPKGIKLIEN